MSDSTEKERVWIVYMDRANCGPYKTEEIHALIAKQQLRVTDLAYLVTSPNIPPDWKFLWQFSEFDRRKNEPKPPPPVIANQRKTYTPEQVREKAYSNIPKELWGISQAEGMPPVASHPHNLESPRAAKLLEKTLHPKGWPKWRLPAAAGVAFVGVVVWIAMGSAPVSIEEPAKNPVQVIDARQAKEIRRPASVAPVAAKKVENKRPGPTGFETVGASLGSSVEPNRD